MRSDGGSRPRRASPETSDLPMPASRTTRSRLLTVFELVVAVSLVASGCAGDDSSGFFALLHWAPGIVVIVRLGSKFGLMGGGFEIVCKIFACTVVSLVAWMAAHSSSPGLSMWPFVLAGVLVIPGLLSFLVLHVVLRTMWSYLVAIDDDPPGHEPTRSRRTGSAGGDRSRPRSGVADFGPSVPARLAATRLIAPLPARDREMHRRCPRDRVAAQKPSRDSRARSAGPARRRCRAAAIHSERASRRM